MLEISPPKPGPSIRLPPRLAVTLSARVLRHDQDLALTTLFFGDGELRVPLVPLAVDAGVKVRIYARDVSIALSRPMDVSITNRLPGEIAEIEFLMPPYVRATIALGATHIHALVTRESVARLALVPGLKAWAMIKAVAIAGRLLKPDLAPRPRTWPSDQTTNRENP
jgi:molybdate transport system ATP-binding protein